MGDIEHGIPPLDAGASRKEAQRAIETGIEDVVYHVRGNAYKAFVPLDAYLGAVALTPNEAALLEVLAREEVAKHEHPPHDLVRARDKLRAHAERGQ